ncbi:hypothetical protein [Nocardioides yefusunii]|uniref:Uncharacterized protein n=1 Tax=Nocardioides yefusunii TaxID=2500546 RepID=A0ABW1QTY1_9ACTN|nr:hypothetical protein [Nocardioides yefusunii]
MQSAGSRRDDEIREVPHPDDAHALVSPFDQGLPGLSDRDLEVSPAAVTAAWDRLIPPPGYEPAFAALKRAAVEHGLHPHALDGPSWPSSGMAALAESMEWAASTCVLYAKVARYCHLPVPRITTRDPDAAPLPFPLLLRADATNETTDLDVLRALVWLRIAHSWPAPLPAWTRLQTEHVTISGDDLHLTHPDAGPDSGARHVVVPGAAHVWAAWLSARRSHSGLLDASPWALCTLRPGPGTRAGSPMSQRTLQSAFARHTALAAFQADANADAELAERYRTLTYDTLRRLLMTTDPVARANVGESRGSTRARRRGTGAAPESAVADG